MLQITESQDQGESCPIPLASDAHVQIPEGSRHGKECFAITGFSKPTFDKRPNGG
jgi:hypothetical protein